LAAAELATEHEWEQFAFSNWAVAELVEAAARSGDNEGAVAAHRRLTEWTLPSGTDWALGLESRSHALLSDGDAAEDLYRESIDRLERAGVRAELARAYLLYGEWLRRVRRRTEARQQLHSALEMLESMGMEGFAQRARRELRATGQATRKRRAEATGQLTAQEAQVARLAREGLSNPEIGTRLFISARTVQYHLSKVFTKLDINSRSQLYRVLEGAGELMEPGGSRSRASRQPLRAGPKND
jgi:DNA-binding CsgD family transcriptional regulator